jgi:hypothetical protein
MGFAFGSNRLWIDRVPGMSQAELSLQVTTAGTAAAADDLVTAGVARCDEIEPLDSDSAFWITSSGGIVHLVSEPDTDR